MAKEDKERGLYAKYYVERRDGHSHPGGKHWHCEHFVLDLHCDPYALLALAVYADACEDEYPQLAADLREKIAEGEQVQDKKAIEEAKVKIKEAAESKKDEEELPARKPKKSRRGKSL